MSGPTNVGDAFDMTAERPAAASTFAGIVRLVEQAQRSKAPMVRLADRFAIWFLGLTIAIAGSAWALTGDPIRAVAVLVVATPCPLILAVPVALVAGLSRAAKQGILIKGAKALETMARVSVIVLDKTGTLTDGRPGLVAIHPAEGFAPEDVLRLAASVDQASKHTIAQTLVAEARARGLVLAVPSQVTETSGEGVEGIVDGRCIVVGGRDFVAGRLGLPPAALAAPDAGAVTVALGVDGRLAGELILADALRQGTDHFLRDLRRLGIERLVLATGDRREVAAAITEGLALDSVRSELTPDQKVMVVLAERKHGPVMMIGDGVNDAPALAAADLGVAMGARGRRGLGGGGGRGAPRRPTRPHPAGPQDRTAGAPHRARERCRRHRPLSRRHGHGRIRTHHAGPGRSFAGGDRRCCDPQCTPGAAGRLIRPAPL